MHPATSTLGQPSSASLEESAAGWRLQATDRTGYTSPALANGMIGLVASEQVMQVKQVVLNGVYDKYGRGEVSNIVQGILFADVSVQIGSGQHWWDESWQKQVSDWTQTLDTQRACLRTGFTLAGSVCVQHELYALRQLPHSALIRVRVEALQASSVTVRNLMRIPAPLQPGRMSYKFQEET
ncbi:MAG: hypothetical protein U1F42_11495, partial [Candidatus Competibacteraceae bacterium]